MTSIDQNINVTKILNMRWADPLVVHPDRNRKRGLQKAFRAVSEFFEIHSEDPLIPIGPRYSVADLQHKAFCHFHLK